MPRRLAPLLVASVLFAASCSSPTAVLEDFEFGEPFWLRPGDVALSADGSTAVEVVRIAGDSFCRAPLVCIWQGELSVEVRVRRLPQGGESVVTLHSETGPDAILAPVARSIELQEVGGDLGTSPQTARYRLRFVVGLAGMR